MLDKLLVELMTPPAYLQAPQNWHAQEGQVTQDIQNFVPNEFFRVP